jgi:hypothetical protein
MNSGEDVLRAGDVLELSWGRLGDECSKSEEEEKELGGGDRQRRG